MFDDEPLLVHDPFSEDVLSRGRLETIKERRRTLERSLILQDEMMESLP